jgi:hypothetical protein
MNRVSAYRLLFLLCFLIAFGRAVPVRAANITASSCSSSAVQTAINSASSGDTVTVPSGSCTWSSTVTISGKALTLQGATTCSGSPLTCTDNTVINTSVLAISVTGSATKFVSISGLTLNISGGDPNNGVVAFGGTEGDAAFRFHHSHLTITGSAAMVGVVAIGSVYGLIDHLVVSNSATNNHTFLIHGDWATGGFHSWARANSFGTNGAIYIEDSVFTLTHQTDGLLDGFTGGRVVFRYNTATFGGSESGSWDTIGFHGTDSGFYRSFFSAEMYGNTMTNNMPSAITPFHLRGGTGLVYSNTFNGSGGWHGINLQNYRADGNGPYSNWGACNGTNWKLVSIDPTTTNGRTNSTSGTVFWCAINRDTPAISNATCSAITPGDTATTYFDGSGAGGYPCRDNPGRTHNQALAPVYAWLNSPNLGISGEAGIIDANRDYYAYTGSFTGASGMGSGAASSRPSSCTTGVAYWGTDTSTLYRCTATNTWAAYYTPYTYPHPLGGGGTSPPPPPPPGAPVNLRIVR